MGFFVGNYFKSVDQFEDWQFSMLQIVNIKPLRAFSTVFIMYKSHIYLFLSILFVKPLLTGSQNFS